MTINDDRCQFHESTENVMCFSFKVPTYRYLKNSSTLPKQTDWVGIAQTMTMSTSEIDLATNQNDHHVHVDRLCVNSMNDQCRLIVLDSGQCY